jgi:hypothetical protein
MVVNIIIMELKKDEPGNIPQKKAARENEFEWNQFCRLGEMMGDGLHREPGGSWISRDYARLSKILIPEIKEASKVTRKLKADAVDRNIAKLLENRNCNCGGKLIQKRKGTKVVYCQICNARYIAHNRKK